MKPILLFIIFTISTPVFSAQNIIGKFSTVSESECNSEIHFLKNGEGVFIDACHREDGSLIGDIKKSTISWQIKNKELIVKIHGISETVTCHDKLSCVYFGENGHSNSLVGFDLYFWKTPIKCK